MIVLADACLLGQPTLPDADYPQVVLEGRLGPFARFRGFRKESIRGFTGLAVCPAVQAFVADHNRQKGNDRHETDRKQQADDHGADHNRRDAGPLRPERIQTDERNPSSRQKLSDR
jgi:hypothetical protein